MTPCCQDRCCGTNLFFSKMSAYFDRQYRKHGLEKIQRHLLEGVRRDLSQSASLLDIGCGVGALHLALLREGARSAVGVEISEGMLDRARRHASELGLQNQTHYIRGDFVECQAEIHASDVSMLDKVVCCYPDLDALLVATTQKTNCLLAITHPRNNLLAATLFKVHIAVARVVGLSFHPFWHDWERMHGGIESQGFDLIHLRSTPVWQARVYRKRQPSPPRTVPSEDTNLR